MHTQPGTKSLSRSWYQQETSRLGTKAGRGNNSSGHETLQRRLVKLLIVAIFSRSCNRPSRSFTEQSNETLELYAAMYLGSTGGEPPRTTLGLELGPEPGSELSIALGPALGDLLDNARGTALGDSLGPLLDSTRAETGACTWRGDRARARRGSTTSAGKQAGIGARLNTGRAPENDAGTCARARARIRAGHSTRTDTSRSTGTIH
jgi:hypothetical protein